MKRLIQVADKLVEKGHSHAENIKTWVAAVDQRYKDFSARMEKYRIKLETELGLTTDVCGERERERDREREYGKMGGREDGAMNVKKTL